MRNAEFGRSCMTFPATSHESQELAFSPELRDIQVSLLNGARSWHVLTNFSLQRAAPKSQAVSIIITTITAVLCSLPLQQIGCITNEASQTLPVALTQWSAPTPPRFLRFLAACCLLPTTCEMPSPPPWAASRVDCPASSIPRVKIAAVDTELSVLVQAGAMVCNSAHLFIARLFSISRLCCCPVFQVRAHRARGLRGKRRWTHGTAMGCWIMDGS